MSSNSNAIDQYRQAKSEYLRLRNQAKKELIARFHQAANEMFEIQRELLEDFGEKVVIPSKARKGRARKPTKSPERKAVEPMPAPAVSRQVAALQAQLQRARKKLTNLQAGGKPTKAAEDRIYELEDALRLAQGK
jgi:hypothetical protein